MRRLYLAIASRILVAGALLLSSVAPAVAQGELGTITGTLTDAQGGVMPGVTATAVNLDTNVKTSAVTNASGVYVLTSLVNGRYRLTCTLDGFSPVVRELEMRAGDRLRVDLTLTIGGITEETKVVAETPLLETTTATRSQVIDKDKVENLPLAGRNPYALAYTDPGRDDAVHAAEHQLTAVRQRRHGRDRDQRRPQSLERAAARRRPQHQPRRDVAGQPGVRAVARRRPGSARQHEHLRRPVRPHRRRRHRRQHPQRHELAARVRLLQPPRRVAQQQPLREHGPRHPEGGSVPLQPRFQRRRPGGAAEVRRPQPDVLLLLVRGAEVRHPGVGGRAGADRPRAQRRLLAVER